MSEGDDGAVVSQKPLEIPGKKTSTSHCLLLFHVAGSPVFPSMGIQASDECAGTGALPASADIDERPGIGCASLQIDAGSRSDVTLAVVVQVEGADLV